MSQSVLGVLLASFTPIKPHQQPWSWANTSQVHKSAYRQLGCAFIKSKAMKTCSGWQFQSFLLDLKRSPGEHRLLINFNCWAVEGCPLYNIIWCKQLWHRAAEMFLASRVLLNAKLKAAEVLLFSGRTQVEQLNPTGKETQNGMLRTNCPYAPSSQCEDVTF